MESLIIFGAKYLIFILISISLVWFAWQSREKQKQLIVFAVITLPAAYVVAKIFSLLYYDPRPFVVGGFAPLVTHTPDNGFPSDHTLLSSAIAMVVLYFNKKIGAVLLVGALLVGAARVLAGVHHTVDITGSFAITVIVSFFIYKVIFPRISKKFLEKTK